MNLKKGFTKIYSADATEGEMIILAARGQTPDIDEDLTLGLTKNGKYIIPEKSGEDDLGQDKIGVEAKLVYEYSYIDEEKGIRYITLKASKSEIPSKDDFDILKNPLEGEIPVETEIPLK